MLVCKFTFALISMHMESTSMIYEFILPPWVRVMAMCKCRGLLSDSSAVHDRHCWIFCHVYAFSSLARESPLQARPGVND